MKLVTGNKSYSSWSLRAWLACKQSGLPFEEQVISLYGADWEGTKLADPLLAPSHGKVPVLWDDDAVVWDSLAILEHLADKVGRDRFWPKAAPARAMARAMVAEMHAGFGALRRELPMNLRRLPAPLTLSAQVHADVVRILTLWAEARARYGQGGPFLFGAFGAADIAFAPVVLRFVTYAVAVPGFARTYMDALLDREWMQAWAKAAAQEEWAIPEFDDLPAGTPI